MNGPIVRSCKCTESAHLHDGGKNERVAPCAEFRVPRSLQAAAR